MNREQPGSIYVPSEYSTTKAMVDAAALSAGQRMLDLGAGDGRVVVEAASRGAYAVGAEIDTSLVSQSKETISQRGLTSQATIFQKSFWDENFSEYDVITIFQSPFVMEKLQEKVLRECRKGTRIVSNTWEFPDLTPTYRKGKIIVYIV